MTAYADLFALAENDRIQAIGTAVMAADQVVGFMVDDDSLAPGKADRYVEKLLANFPNVIVLDRVAGPVKGVTTVRVRRKGTEQ